MKIASKFLIGSLLPVLILSACRTEKTYVTDVDELIGVFQDKFAPDRRVAIFDLAAKSVQDTVLLVGETNLSMAFQELRDTLLRRGIPFRDSVAVLQSVPALVNVSVCNIRSNPKHSAELATQSLLGTTLGILKKEGSWYYVQTPDGYLGWLDGGGLEIPSQANFTQWLHSEKIVVTAPFAFVTSSLDGSNVSDVVEGNIMRLLGKQGRFYQVALPDGRAGLLNQSSAVSYQGFIEREPILENILAKAHEFLGRPYLWGGTSGKGMDCSGYTKTVFYLNGLELPRDASQQVHVGVAVDTDESLKNLQPGDFLFFGRKASADQKERITHVAIYLGDGKMIHSSERVRIQSLRRGDPDFVEHRLKTLVRAKRMLRNIGENGVRPLQEHEKYALPAVVES